MFASLGIDLPTGILLCLALLLALSFEFVNGFHDTANAVATVIYTNTLKPTTAVVWSGSWNLIGVLTSSGAVAFGIVALLPVELVINVGSGAGFAMVFSLLLSAIMTQLPRLMFRHRSAPRYRPRASIPIPRCGCDRRWNAWSGDGLRSSSLIVFRPCSRRTESW